MEPFKFTVHARHRCIQRNVPVVQCGFLENTWRGYKSRHGGNKYCLDNNKNVRTAFKNYTCTFVGSLKSESYRVDKKACPKVWKDFSLIKPMRSTTNRRRHTTERKQQKGKRYIPLTRQGEPKTHGDRVKQCKKGKRKQRKKKKGNRAGAPKSL